MRKLIKDFIHAALLDVPNTDEMKRIKPLLTPAEIKRATEIINAGYHTFPNDEEKRLAVLKPNAFQPVKSIATRHHLTINQAHEIADRYVKNKTEHKPPASGLSKREIDYLNDLAVYWRTNKTFRNEYLDILQKRAVKNPSEPKERKPRPISKDAGKHYTYLNNWKNYVLYYLKHIFARGHEVSGNMYDMLKYRFENQYFYNIKTDKWVKYRGQ